MFADEMNIILRPGAPGRAAPYHRQIYEQIRQAILENHLRPGDRLPSTRDLAARLGLARNTVARAYEDLLAEGYLEGRIGAGTYVASQLGGESKEWTGAKAAAGSVPAAQRALSDWALGVLREVPDGPPAEVLPFDFRAGTPDWNAFPREVWHRLLGRAMRRQSSKLTRYGEPAGHLPLRRAIANHLALSRGVVASAEQVVIVGGSQQALDLLTRLRVSHGDEVAVEDPGYPDARRAFAAAGARLLPVPVDADGLVVDALMRLAARSAPRLVYVTPSHQYPTGVTLSLARRLALLDWATKRDVLVVEDDYDSEFRYSGRPVEALQGLDRSGRVVYLGTFSTVLFPPLRVGYVVLPPDLVAPFVKAKWLIDRQTPTLEQLALADFLAEGHFGRHLRRMRRLATERRAALLAAVGEFLGHRVEPPVASTGMHVLLRLAGGGPRRIPATAIESAITAAAAEEGVGVYPVASCCARPPATPALLLGYASLSVEQIREGVRRLGRVVREVYAEFGLAGH